MRAPKQSPFIYMKTHVLNPKEFEKKKDKGKKRKSKKSAGDLSGSESLEEDAIDQIESATTDNDSTTPVPKWANPKFAEVYVCSCISVSKLFSLLLT